MPRLMMTIGDLARTLGLSASTVSLALRNSPKIKAETRQRVQLAARELGYRPNPAYAAIGSRSHCRKNATAGLPVAYFHTAGQETHGAGLALLQGLQQEGWNRGYDVRAHTVVELGGWSRAERVLRARGYVGVILGPSDQEEVALRLPWDSMAVVSTVGHHRYSPFAAVGFHWFEMTRRIARRLLDCGCMRPGAALFSHTPRNEEDDERLAGWLFETRLLPQTVPAYLGTFEQDAELRSWFEEHRPDALLAFHAGVFHLFRQEIEAGLPFACLNASSHDHPCLYAGMDTNLVCIGTLVVRLLDTLLRQGLLGPLQVPFLHLLSPPLLEGPTLPSPAHAMNKF